LRFVIYNCVLFIFVITFLWSLYCTSFRSSTYHVLS